MAMRVETIRGMQNLNTPHPPESYPGLLVVRPGPQWVDCVIIPEPGASFVALGGEWAPGYATREGVIAEAMRLGKGDRATRLPANLPRHIAEWRVERAETRD